MIYNNILFYYYCYLCIIEMQSNLFSKQIGLKYFIKLIKIKSCKNPKKIDLK